LAVETHVLVNRNAAARADETSLVMIISFDLNQPMGRALRTGTPAPLSRIAGGFGRSAEIRAMRLATAPAAATVCRSAAIAVKPEWNAEDCWDSGRACCAALRPEIDLLAVLSRRSQNIRTRPQTS
jgi:hypothetical protein